MASNKMTDDDKDFMQYLFNTKAHKRKLWIEATENKDNFLEDYLEAAKEYERYRIQFALLSPINKDYDEDRPKPHVSHEAFMKARMAQTEYGHYGENNPPVPANDNADLVNNPPHYTQGDIECIDAIRAALGPEGFRHFLRGNIIKYNWRTDHKGGVQDIEKSRWYCDRLIGELRNQ